MTETAATRLENSQLAIGELVQGSAVAVDARAPLASVAQSLGELGIGVVLVTEQDQVVGVVSERDLVWAIARQADLDDVWAADIMARDIVSVNSQTSLVESASNMIENNVRHIVVDCPDGLGVVSLSDLVARLLPQN